MSMIVNHNIPALSTYNVVNATSNALSKSIKKLSTGLRINSAADDAAGLAISEKMRAQISGLSKASENAQDGISMLQTAEGALTETHSILQRMRELSVQAANDTLTAQDRSYIQLEIDELRDEITNIGNTTQFNTKKLLNGDAAVLWSADDNNTKAIINGGLRKIDQFGQKRSNEANYKISITADPGEAQVQKTDIMKLKHNTTGNVSTKTTDAPLTGTFKNTFEFSGTDTPAGVAATTAIAITVGGTAYTLATTDATGVTDSASLATALMTYADDGSGNKLSSVATLTGGSNKITVTLKNTTDMSSSLPTGTITYGTPVNTINSANPASTPQTGSSYTNTITIDDLTQQDIDDFVDKAQTLTVKIGGKTVTVIGGADVTNKTAADVATAIQTKVQAADSALATSTAVASGTGTGPFKIVITSSDTTAADTTMAATGAFAKPDGKIGDIANANTSLRDIDKFWTSEGVFMLEDPQTITITQGDGKQTSITIYGTDTIQDVETKLNDAIGKDVSEGGLGQNAYVAAGTKFATFNPTAAAVPSANSVAGTFVIRSAVAGSAGELNFSADENLLNALSLNEIHASSETRYTVNVVDAHDNTKVIAKDVMITGNKLVGILDDNVDVQFDSMLGAHIKATDDKGYFDLNDDGNYVTYLHLSDNTTVFQVGANEGEDMLVNMGDMRATALGLDKVLVTDRDSAARSITVIDDAIDKVSTQRAKIGAYQNRLEYKISNLTTAYENMTSAESRIRDTDMAKEMMNFMKLQINLQAGTAMLSQANQLTQNVLSLIR